MPGFTPIMYKGKLYRTKLKYDQAKAREKLKATKTVGKSPAQKKSELAETARRRTGSKEVLPAHKKAAAKQYRKTY